MDSELSSPGPRTFQGSMQAPCDILVANVGPGALIPENQ